MTTVIFLFVVAAIVITGCGTGTQHRDWPVYKADARSSSYSELNQINRQNVDRLEVAWTYRTGDMKEEGYSTMETNPIVIDGVLYGASPRLSVFALDAANGRELWFHRTLPDNPPSGYVRAVAYWESEDRSEKRILYSAGTYLFALDAENGEPIPSFGDGGRVSLNVGLGRDPESIAVKSPSPGIIYRDLIIMGSAVGEGYNAAPGHIRAYDVRSGEIIWTFYTIPKPGEPGYDTWKTNPPGSSISNGGVNNWTGFSLDRERGIVYVPLGSAAYDFYGADRPGKNLFSNALVALDAATGERIWHYQTVHHDLWDYDLPAPPNLVTVDHEGKRVDAVAQLTKTGFTFLLDRETGTPLFEVEERPVPGSRMPGEQPWPTQPYPSAPEPFVRRQLVPGNIDNLVPGRRDSISAMLREYRYEGLFTPPDTAGTIMFPGTRGGANWGGGAYDPETGLLYVNANEAPELISMEKVQVRVDGAVSKFEKGKTLYQAHCASCHGMERQGMPPANPELATVDKRFSRNEVRTMIENGGGRMPAFTHITEVEKDAIIAFLYGERQSGSPSGSSGAVTERDSGQKLSRYMNVTSYKKLEGPGGLPVISPPWGTLNAIDLNSGKLAWKVPFGMHPGLAGRTDIPETGMENWGGPMATGGGLVFMAGTRDKMFRAFDKTTGHLLWETELPAGGFATPATYMVNGKQYVVIACGGGRGTGPGDYYVAFALPGN